MNDEEEFARMESQVGDALGSWLYPECQFRGHGAANDLKFIHAQYTTADSIDDVRDYYWKKCQWTHDRTGGSFYQLDEYPKRFFRSGPPMALAYATKQDTISVMAVPSESHETALFITLDVR